MCRNRNSALSSAHQFAQVFGIGDGDEAQFCIFAFAAAGLKLDLTQPHHPRQRLLFDADILDPLIGDRARIAAKNAAFNADVMFADMIAKSRPGEPAEEQAGEQNDDDDDRNQDWIVCRTNTENGGDERKNQLRQPCYEADEEPGNVEAIALVRPT